jgi:hypothetical protein
MTFDFHRWSFLAINFTRSDLSISAKSLPSGAQVGQLAGVWQHSESKDGDKDFTGLMK